MKERPILFSGPLVQALLEGRKDVTRRVIKPDWWRCLDPEDPDDRAKAADQNPYGVPGDQLWVRETHALCWATHWPDLPHRVSPGYSPSATEPCVAYYREGFDRAAPRWRPSIHMPRWASRIQLEVVSVRVERLVGGMDDLEAQREGFENIEEFRRVWDQISAKRGFSWASNPWVWRVECPVLEVHCGR